jgi:hypothetical protein
MTFVELFEFCNRKASKNSMVRHILCTPKNPWRGGGTHIRVDPAHMPYKGITPPPELTSQKF